MRMPDAIRDKYTMRFTTLLADAEKIAGRVTIKKGRPRAIFNGQVISRLPDFKLLDYTAFTKWRTNCTSLLEHVIRPANSNRSVIREFQTYDKATPRNLAHLSARLAAIREDFESGFLDDPWSVAAAEVAADYLTQAEVLISEAYHVPAAVLAGAVLEDALRKLCVQHGIPTESPKGKRKSIDPMNSDLKKAGVYRRTTSKHITAWAGLRNDAAHGDGDKNDPKDVARMIDGVRSFVGDYLK